MLMNYCLQSFQTLLKVTTLQVIMTMTIRTANGKESKTNQRTKEKVPQLKPRPTKLKTALATIVKTLRIPGFMVYAQLVFIRSLIKRKSIFIYKKMGI